MSIAAKAAEWALTKIGCAYSQSKRMNTNPDIFDCSSLVLRAFSACGYKFTSGSRSCDQVTDKGFALLWPASQSAVGQTRTKISDLKAQGWTPRAGDLLFMCTDSSTSRANKITHVAFVLDKDRILHARGTNYGVRTDALTLYDGKLVALTRFKEEGADTVVTKESGVTEGHGLVTGGSVNVRTGVGTSAPIIRTVHRGDLLPLTGRGQDGWHEITLPDGRIGWISGKYLSVGK